MRTLTSSLGKICGSGCILVCTASGLLASDIVLQKVPAVTAPAPDSASRLGPQATFALINYSVANTRQARALYVSSGDDLKLANSMVDEQATTSFGFSAEDSSPTAVIDLGKVCTVKHLSATYLARPGSVDFYVMKSLPGTERDHSSNTWKLDDKAFANLKPVGSTVDDGTQGRASIDLPATSGRYVMMRWTPASRADGAFTVAEVTALGPDQRNLIASSRNFSSASERTIAADSKDVADSKDISDSKDIPEPAAPAEGPPPSLPGTPPFTFIPQLVPVSR